MGENERSLRELCPELPSKADNPSLGLPVAGINGVEILSNIQCQYRLPYRCMKQLAS